MTVNIRTYGVQKTERYKTINAWIGDEPVREDWNGRVGKNQQKSVACELNCEG